MIASEPIVGLEVLQSYVHSFGANIINAFDVGSWTEATTIEVIAIQLIVRAGEVEVALQQIDASGERQERFRLYQSGKGVVSTPSILLRDLSGALLPVVTSASEDANYEIVFVTDDAPAQPYAKINYIFCTFKRAEYVQRNAEVFRDYLRRRRNHAHAAHLTVIDNAATGTHALDCGVTADADVSVIANQNTGGAGGFGRGIYESVYGGLAQHGFSHLCLLDDDIYLSPEMFARNTAMVRYLKPGIHLGAPMYPTSSPQSGPVRSACFGHRYRGSVHPSDQALGVRLETSQPEAFLQMDRSPDTTGWWWDCIAIEDIHRIGLPYPFFIKMDDVEYGLRLKNAGVKLVIPFSFWVLHDDFEEKYSASMQYFRFRNRLVLLCQQGLPMGGHALEVEWRKLVTEMIQGRKYEHAQLLLDGMRHFLRGPDYLLQAEKTILAGVFRITRNEKNVRMPDSPKGSSVVNGRKPPKPGWDTRLNMLTANHHFVSLKKHVVIDTTRPFAITDCRFGRTVTYWNSEQGVGYTVFRDSWRAFGQLVELNVLSRKLRASLPKLAEQYSRRKAHLISPAFWATYGQFGTRLRLKKSDIEAPAERDLRRELGRVQMIVQRSEAERRVAETQVSNEDLLFLNAVRNSHQGERCFVLGNGPSLTVADLERLVGEVTFAANKIYLCFDQTTWRPTYYSVEDLLVAQNNRTQIMALEGMTKIFPDHMLKYLPRRPNHHYARWLPPADNTSPFRRFSNDLVKGVCWGSTITYSMLQMAVHMGFKEIYLLGIDHSYIEPETRVDGALVSQGERNHFHPDYRKPGERWHFPVLDRLENSYRYAREATEAMGVKVWNASRFSKLEAFDRADLDEVLKHPPSRRPA